MNMKISILSFLLFPAVLLTGLLSCSLEDRREPGRGGEITLRTTVDGMTKADPVTDLTAYGKSMSVYAYQRKTGTRFLPFFGENFTLSNGVWSSTNPYYWPGSDQLVFFAFNGREDLSALGATVEMPTGEVSGLNQGSGNEQNCRITGVTIPREASSQIDLMVGREGPRPEGAVSVNLRHALSQIKIQAKCSRPGIKVEVAGVKIMGVKDVATLLLPSGNTTVQNPSTGMSADRWTDKDFSAEADGFIAMQGNLTQGSQAQVLDADCQDITSGGGSFMLIPQGTADGVQGWDGSAGDTDGAYIAVLCRISQRKGAADADGYTQLYPVGAARAGLYAWTAVPFQPDWIPGNTYTYCLEFFGTSGGGGKVPPVYPGEEGPAISDNPGVSPGETVVGGPISLTVSVADWYAGTAGGGEWNNSVTMPNSNN